MTQTDKMIHTAEPRVSGYDALESDLVYPLGKGYKQVHIVDPVWVSNILRRRFGRAVTRINNKYAVLIDEHLYYQHDDHTWLLEVE